MYRVIVLALIAIVAISTATGFVLSRSAQAMKLKVHVKDLPEHGLTVISPADPSFEGRLTTLLKGKSNDVVNNLRPFSVFVENRGQRAVVAYIIQWCFTSADGRNDCYRKALTNPIALMEGGSLSEEQEEQSGRIKPNSTRFFSLVSLDGRGAFRVPVSPNEAEQFRHGKSDPKELLRRYSLELTKYTDVTVSIDGAFFEDGTFVGSDTIGFFAQAKAMTDARKDLLNEIALGLSEKTKDEVFGRLEGTANQPDVGLDSQSTSTDYYNYYKKVYADEVLQLRRAHGDDEGLRAALKPTKKALAGVA